MPKAGVRVVFGLIEHIVGVQLQAQFRFKQTYSVDFTLCVWHVLIKPPAKPAKKIQLSLFGKIVIFGVNPGLCVIPAAVDLCSLCSNCVWMLAQIGGIQIDRVGEHRGALFLSVER